MSRHTSSVAEQNRLLSDLLALHPPATPTPTPTPTAANCAFASAAQEHHVVVKVSDQVPAGRGLVFTQRIEPGQVLLKLPSDALINVKSYKCFFHPDTLPSAPSVARATKISQTRLSSAQLLSLLLARAQIESDLGQSNADAHISTKHDALQLFVQTLPKRFDTVPLIWSSLAHGLGPSSDPDVAGSMWKQRFFRSLLLALPQHSHYLQHKVRTRFEKDWLGICSLRESDADMLADPALLSSNPGLARSIVRSIDLDTFLWAWLCVNSRCVFLPLGLADHADNFTLAPMLDMANHTPDPAFECKVRYASDGGLELCSPTQHQRTTSDLASWKAMPDDECCITYGPHSNQSLLSEYGFVLPAKLTFANDPSMDSAASTREHRWSGSRYIDVLVDQDIESLLKAQGDAGEAKIEFLQNRGYWGEFTIHPYPEPAHPSHRLIPALRLAALDIYAPSPNPKLVKVKAQQGFKAARKAFFQAQAKFGAQDPSSPLERWEETLTGYRDIVSKENEQHAHDILHTLCQTRRVKTRQARKHLAVSQAVLESLGKEDDVVTTRSRLEPDRNGCFLSLAFVKQLLDEEEAVLRLVSQAAEDQIEW